MGGCKRLRNRVQHYAWGSKSFLPDWLGMPNAAAEPWAELWIGAHERCPSMIEAQPGEWLPLDRWIADDPERALGRETIERFGDELPYLLKVLSAAEPLSLQVHPTREQAEAGFYREEAAGLAVDAKDRTYPDPRAKAEMMLALTPFDAMCGFRPWPERERLLSALGEPWTRLARIEDPLECLGALLRDPPVDSSDFGRVLGDAVRPRGSEDPAYRWSGALCERYPHDPGCLSPFLLNVVSLEPGQALFLEPGVLHAYLEGNGLEVMVSSDNVLRAGLTRKFVDLEQLLSVIDPDLCQYREIRPQAQGAGRSAYEVPCDAFRLEEIETSSGPTTLPPSGGPELLLVAGGELHIAEVGDAHRLHRGDALFLLAARQEVQLSGGGSAFRVTVGGSRT